jgi:hypothetical protein
MIGGSPSRVKLFWGIASAIIVDGRVYPVIERFIKLAACGSALLLIARRSVYIDFGQDVTGRWGTYHFRGTWNFYPAYWRKANATRWK